MHGAPHRERVGKGDHVEQQEGRDGRLVEQQLHAAHLQLAVVAGDPDGVQRGSEDARKGEDDAQTARRLDVDVGRGQRVVVTDHTDAGARGNQRQHGVQGERGLVQDEVHEGHAGGEQDAGDLVEGDGREGEREVRQDDVKRHGNGQGDDVADGGAARHEEGEAWAREDVQREPCDAKVEGCKGELNELQGRVGEDCLVGEDLVEIMSAFVF